MAHDGSNISPRIEAHILSTGIKDSIYDSFEDLHSARVYWRFALEGNYTEVATHALPVD